MAYILSSQNVRIDQQPASIGARAGATIIDLILFGGMEWGVISLLNNTGLNSYGNKFFIFVLLFLPLTYPLLCEIFMSGQTIGKRLFHTRVVTLEGGGPKVTALILRWLMLSFDLIGAMGLGELCVFFTKRQQRLGDLIAGTWVVKTQTYDTENINLDEYQFPKNYTITYPKAKNLRPDQASLIAEALEAAEKSEEVSLALYDLSHKVELITGPSQESSTEYYLSKVLSDYRFDK